MSSHLSSLQQLLLQQVGCLVVVQLHHLKERGVVLWIILVEWCRVGHHLAFGGIGVLVVLVAFVKVVDSDAFVVVS